MKRIPSIERAKRTMGLTYIDATIESLDRSRPACPARFLVDTGAIDCLLPSALMIEAGVTVDGIDLYELADGRSLELPFGWARLNFLNTFVLTKAIFGPDDAEPLLGAIALESAGITVDPINQTLKRLAARSLKRAA